MSIASQESGFFFFFLNYVCYSGRSNGGNLTAEFMSIPGEQTCLRVSPCHCLQLLPKENRRGPLASVVALEVSKLSVVPSESLGMACVCGVLINRGRPFKWACLEKGLFYIYLL